MPEIYSVMILSWMYQCMPIILALGRLKQEDFEAHEFKVNLRLHSNILSQKNNSWGCSSVVGCLPSVYKMLDLIPSTMHTHTHTHTHTKIVELAAVFPVSTTHNQPDVGLQYVCSEITQIDGSMSNKEYALDQ
jgi:hypothetical protein